MKTVKAADSRDTNDLASQAGGQLELVTGVAVSLDVSGQGAIGLTFQTRRWPNDPVNLALSPPAAEFLRQELKSKLKGYLQSEFPETE